MESLGCRINELPLYPSIDNFEFIWDYEETISELVEKLHQIIGVYIAHAITDNMFEAISNSVPGYESSKDESESIDEFDESPVPSLQSRSTVPPSAFDKSYNFISLLSESKPAFEKAMKSFTIGNIKEEYNYLANYDENNKREEVKGGRQVIWVHTSSSINTSIHICSQFLT